MVFFDIDGVLGRLEEWAKSKDPNVFKQRNKREFEFRLTTLFLQHYKEAFAVSELIMGGVELLDKHKNEKVKFITALPRKEPFLFYYPYLAESYKEHGKLKDIDHIFHTFEENKKHWVENVLGFNRDKVIIVEQHRDKVKYCKKGDILYDDNPYTCKQWENAGGIAKWVKFSDIEWLDVEGQANDLT